MITLETTPSEFAVAVQEFWPESEWDNCANVALLESGLSAFALNDTSAMPVDANGFIYYLDGVGIAPERSVGWFQIETLQLPPGWRWFHLFNTRHNVGTAHLYWSQRGWSPWLISARKLGLLPNG